MSVELKTNLELSISNLEKQDNIENLARAMRDALTQLEARGSAAVPADYTPVKTSTLQWLLGELGEFEKPDGAGTWWWRKDLRKAMLSAAPTPPSAEHQSCDDIYAGHKSLAEMVSTHTHVWRAALQSEIQDLHDNSYFIHELKALDDIEKAVKHDLDKQPDSAAPEPYGYVYEDDFNNGYGQAHLSFTKIDEWASKGFAVYRHKPQRITEQDAREIWVHGYEAGHNDGIGCGHSLAPRCRHVGEKEFYAEDISNLLAKLNEHREPDYKAMAEELYQALKHLHHNARKSGSDMGLALDVASKAIAKHEGVK